MDEKARTVDVCKVDSISQKQQQNQGHCRLSMVVAWALLVVRAWVRSKMTNDSLIFLIKHILWP